MRSFKHVNAKSVDQVTSLLDEFKDKAALTAGGTDLLGGLKDNIYPGYPELVISLRNIENLDYVKNEGDALRIGALAVIHDIEKNPAVTGKYGILSEAAHAVASPHIRHMGTIGGNICQDNRCWYYRNAENRFNCIRKGGQECFALVGENQYHSVFGAAKIDMSACSKECPTNTDIPLYMEKVRANDIVGAAEILLYYNPIPAVTGRICPHFCQDGCSRHFYDSSVSVRDVERHVGDFILENTEMFYKPPETENGKKVAVVGSGPAGLSSAYYLRKQGCKVTVFECRKEAGGLLRYGIPPYRLPKSVVAKGIAALDKMGIEFCTGVNVGQDVSLESLMHEYNAVFLGHGAWVERKMDIAGEELTTSSLEFLSRVNSENSKIPGKRVAVVGGGNAAIDVARVLLRLGAQPVILYRRSEEEMPAIKEEVLRAKEEGVEFKFLTLPVSAAKKEGYIELECVRMELGERDEAGRAKPVCIKGSEYKENYDAVIKGIGQTADLSLLPKRFCHETGGLKTRTGSAKLGENLFAGGDMATGPATVVQALAAGRKAAEEISGFLGYTPPKNTGQKANYGLICGAGMRRKEGVTAPPELPVAERIKSIHTEDISGLNRELVKEEANRCLNCGCVAVSQSDMAPALIALDAVIKTNKRDVKAEDFFAAEKLSTTVLDNNEMVTEIIIPEVKTNTKQTYLKFSQRRTIDFPVIGVAVVITLDAAGKAEKARLVLSGVAPVPLRARTAEDYLLGKKIGEEEAAQAAAIAMSPARALVKNAHKIPITQALIKRAILKALR